MRLLLLSICFAQLPPILPKADDSDNPGATALPVVNVLYTHEEGSGVQDLEEREEAAALQERVTNMTVRMRERESVLNAILQLGRKLAGQKSFLKLRKPEPGSLEGIFAEYTRKMRELKATLEAATNATTQPAGLTLPESFFAADLPPDATNGTYEALADIAMNELLPQAEAAVKQFSALQATVASAAQVRSEKMPCSTQADCDSVAAISTACMGSRVGLLASYDGMNAGMSTYGQIIAKLCGCIFAGPMDICALAPAPWCSPPSLAFLVTFEMSHAMWVAAIATTNLCQAVGDPLYASPR